MERPRRKRRFTSRKKRTLDPNLVIDYKNPDVLSRFITKRGKIIPRRISGATSKQQRQIALAVKRARFLGLLHASVSHRHEKGFAGEMAAATMMLSGMGRGRFDRDGGRDQGRMNPAGPSFAESASPASAEEE